MCDIGVDELWQHKQERLVVVITLYLRILIIQGHRKRRTGFETPNLKSTRTRNCK